ncbi:MAG: TolC family protein [Candidatus Latescibacterota bacterium]
MTVRSLSLLHATPMLGIAVLAVCVRPTPGAGDTLTVEAAVRLALERNPEVASARQEWQAARARAVQARALPDPEAEIEWEGLPEVGRFGDFEDRFAGVRQSLGWPLEWWHRRAAADRAAEAVRLAALAMTELEVTARVKVAFASVLSSRQVLQYEEENLALARDFAERSRQRFGAGDVPELEVLRAEVEAGRAAVRLAAAQNELAAARAALNALMALDTGAPLEATGELGYAARAFDLEDLQHLAAERRPDLLGAQRQVAGQQALRSAARAAVVPDLNLGLFRQTARQPDGDEAAWRVSVGLAVPLWAGFRQRGELAEASAEVGRAQAQADAVRRQVRLEVETALLDLSTAEQQVRLFQEGIRHEAEEAHQAARRRYAGGKATYLELLEAQRTLAETRAEYARALLAYSVALTTLERAAGGPLPQ